MENVIWAVLLWVSLFLLVPFNRIKKLWPAAVIGLVLSFIINYGPVAFYMYGCQYLFWERGRYTKMTKHSLSISNNRPPGFIPHYKNVNLMDCIL